MIFIKDKPPIALISMHPSNHGGILSSLKVLYEFASLYFEPRVFCLGFSPDITSNIRQFSLRSYTRDFVYHGMNCTEIGARFARFEHKHYRWTLGLWRRALKDYQYFFVTSGTPHAAEPLMLLDKKYVLWLASTYFDDRRRRLEESSFTTRWMNSFIYPAMADIERKVLRNARVLAPISSYTRDLCNAVQPVRHGITKVCPVPVRLQVDQPETKSKPYRVMIVGRLTDPRKNIAMFLRVARSVLSTSCDVVFDVVGAYDSSNPEICALSEQFGDRIIFYGEVSDEALKSMYHDAFALLITSYQEGLGIVGLEALSWGVPVIATRCGGVSDYVIPDVSGILVDIDNDDQMTQALLRLINNSDVYHVLQKGALETIKNRFLPENVFTVFKQLLSFAYPELGHYFYCCDQHGVNYEYFSSGARVSGIHKPA